MEWSWLRDWWRLKRLRRPNVRRIGEYHGSDTENDDDDDDDICFCDECVNVCANFC